MKNLLHCIRFLIGFDSPFSQVTDAELNALKAHAPRDGVIVELGCYEGKTAVELAKATQAIIYTIDPFASGRLGISYQYIIARTHAKRQGVNNLIFVQALSWDATIYIDSKVDFLFIDADHSYSAVRKDFEVWLPKVSLEGIVAMHDAVLAPNSPHYLGSMKYFYENIRYNSAIELLEIVDSLALFKRRL